MAPKKRELSAPPAADVKDDDQKDTEEGGADAGAKKKAKISVICGRCTKTPTA
jgi:hypothetical protein